MKVIFESQGREEKWWKGGCIKMSISPETFYKHKQKKN